MAAKKRLEENSAGITVVRSKRQQRAHLARNGLPMPEAPKTRAVPARSAEQVAAVYGAKSEEAVTAAESVPVVAPAPTAKTTRKTAAKRSRK